MKKYLLIISFISILYSLYEAFSFGRTYEKNKLENELKQKEIETQNQIIKNTQEVYARKIINKSVPTDDNINWLQQNICKDCPSR